MRSVIAVSPLPNRMNLSNKTSKTQPSLAQSFPLDWVESLKKIEAFDIDFIVPGHGEVCDREEARRFHLFLQQCIGMITDAIKKGMTIGEAADKLSFEDLYPGKGTGFAVHPGPEQQRRNVFRLYEMLSK